MEGSLDISEDGQVFYLLFFSIKAFDYLGKVKIISPISTRSLWLFPRGEENNTKVFKLM